MKVRKCSKLTLVDKISIPSFPFGRCCAFKSVTVCLNSSPFQQSQESMEQELVPRPATAEADPKDAEEVEDEIDEEITSGRYFLRLLAENDQFFGILAEDYMEDILATPTPLQSIANFNIIGVCIGDYGLSLTDEAVFSIMAGDTEVADMLADDIKKLRNFNPSTLWKTLQPTQTRVDLRSRLNPFEPVTSDDNRSSSSRASRRDELPTIIFVHDAERLQKSRSQLITMLKDYEAKILRFRIKREQDALAAAEAEKQRIVLEQQTNSLSQKKSEMLKSLEELEANFTEDSRKLAQLRKVIGLPEAHPDRSPRTRSPDRIRVESRIPFDRLGNKR